ncbi:MAG TPA: hypothetical protein VJY35_11325 [Candidatus Eisenbacteria bacterium]|nr:hypothetical protein [Candidatus Eisenbacteria bacterium]
MAARRFALGSTPLRLALGCVTALALVASPAGAGIRDMVKSAKDKAAKTTGDKPAAGPTIAVPTFDERTLELTDARVAQVLAGLKAAAPHIEQRKQVLARQEALQKEIDELNSKHGEAIGANMSKRDEVKSCLHEAIDERQKARVEEAIRNPQAHMDTHRRVAELTAKFAEAQAKGDTALARKYQEQAAAVVAPTPEDSAAARKKCGAPPPPLPAGIQLERLNAEHGATFEQTRALDLKAMEAQKTSGLTEDQMAIAIHRIVFYLKNSENGTPSGFTPAEQKALAANKGALAAAMPL